MNRHPSSRAGVELLRERVRMYGEYAELLEEQERAADAGELERVSELTARLRTLEESLGHVMGGAPSGHLDADPPELAQGGATGPSLVDAETQAPESDEAHLHNQARAILERAAATQRRVVEKLRDRRDQARGELRSLEGRDDQVRSYLRGNQRGTGRLNVRF